MKAQDDLHIRLGNGEQLAVKGVGNVNIECLIDSKWKKCTMSDVWYVPELNKNLFSEGVVTKKGMKVVKEGNKATIIENGVVKAVAERGATNLYKLAIRTTIPEVNVTSISSLKIWHERLGHVNFKTIKDMVQKGDIHGITLEDVKPYICDGCQYGKQHKLPFHKIEPRNTKPGELIHTDLCRPMSVPSVRGCLYFVLFKDDATNFRKVYFRRHKSDTLEHFKTYTQLCENKFGLYL